MAYAQASYSSSSPLSSHYAETMSAVHPDRPIRPLPKRRLKKLSDAQSDPAASPLASSGSERLFQLPYYPAPSLSQRSTSRNSSLEAEAGDGSNSDSPEDHKARINLPVRAKTSDRDAGKPVARTDGWSSSGASKGVSAIDRRERPRQGGPNEPPPVASCADSVDGYDSFENTNNKKKRKIPTHGGHHTSLSTEMAAMGLPSSRDTVSPSADHDGGVGQYYGSGSSAMSVKSGNGFSGAGRGRLGRGSARRRSNRSPLGVSTNSGNLALPTHGSTAELATKENLSPYEDVKDTLTASNRIHDQMSPSSTKQIHGAGPSQHGPNDTPEGKTQFTFTCESDSAKSISWPEYGYPSLPGAYPDTMPNGIDGNFDTVPEDAIQNMKGYGSAGAQGDSQRASGGNQMGPPRRTKRSLVKQYSSAAKERKVRQAYGNFHHPPRLEEVWICEYCEYEAIFGCPPEALIRQYEIKDRREKRRLAEKQRLLEKAKMRNKRGKKGGKNSKNAHAVTQATPAQQQNQRPRQDHLPGEYPQDQADLPTGDYLLDDYDEDPVVTPTLSSKASASHAPSHPTGGKHQPHGHPVDWGQALAN